jgi:hypothetical protein
MKNARPLTVSNAEVLRALDQRIAGSDDARTDRLVALQGVSTVRNRILKREVERLTQKHGADNPLVVDTAARLEASGGALRALSFEIQRTSLTPPRPSDDAWTIFGIVRDQDGDPLPGVFVAVADANGEIIAPERQTPTQRDGAFSIVVALAHKRVRKTKAAEAKGAEAEEAETGPAGSVHLEVFKAANNRIAVDTIQFRPAAAMVDYREIVVEPPARSDKRAT